MGHAITLDNPKKTSSDQLHSTQKKCGVESSLVVVRSGTRWHIVTRSRLELRTRTYEGSLLYSTSMVHCFLSSPFLGAAVVVLTPVGRSGIRRSNNTPTTHISSKAKREPPPPPCCCLVSSAASARLARSRDRSSYSQ
jgi:hypothetical protein